MISVDIKNANELSLNWAISAIVTPDSIKVIPYTKTKSSEILLKEEGISLRSMSPYPAWAATKAIGDGSGMNHVAEGPTRLIAGFRLFLLLRYPDGSIEVPEYLLTENVNQNLPVRHVLRGRG